jgi:hypothetical protein
MAFVWEVIAAACVDVGQPLIVFVKSVETTVCGSFERYYAFSEAFGPLGSRPLPCVLLGGCSLGETGSHLTSDDRCVCMPHPWPPNRDQRSCSAFQTGPTASHSFQCRVSPAGM